MYQQVQYLIKLRDHLRDQRRKLIHRWATTSKTMPANLTRLVRIQNELHAVEEPFGMSKLPNGRQHRKPKQSSKNPSQTTNCRLTPEGMPNAFWMIRPTAPYRRRSSGPSTSA